jgi:hypothetical protein
LMIRTFYHTLLFLSMSKAFLEHRTKADTDVNDLRMMIKRTPHPFDMENYHPYSYPNHNIIHRSLTDMNDMTKRNRNNALITHHSTFEQEVQYLHEPAPHPMEKLTRQKIYVTDLDDYDDHIGFTNQEYDFTRNNTVNRSLQQVSSSTGCVYNGTQLQSVIERIPKYSPTKIELCSPYMSINASQTNGILVHDKVLDIYCNIGSNVTTNTCIIDAQQTSRLLVFGDQTYHFIALHL